MTLYHWVGGFRCFKDTSVSENEGTIIIIKAIPLQAWTGPEGSRRLKLPHFKTVGT